MAASQRGFQACWHWTFAGCGTQQGTGLGTLDGEKSFGKTMAEIDAAELLQELEAIFYQVPPLVHFGIMGNERLSIGLRRDNGERVSLVQLGADGVTVERLVGEEPAKPTSAISGIAPTPS